MKYRPVSDVPEWFAFQRDDLSGGVTPDIVTFAKGVAAVSRWAA